MFSWKLTKCVKLFTIHVTFGLFGAFQKGFLIFLISFVGLDIIFVSSLTI